jgi:hypothetical protein
LGLQEGEYAYHQADLQGRIISGRTRISRRPGIPAYAEGTGRKARKLKAVLDDSGRELLEGIISLRVGMDGMDNADVFEVGFKIGAGIMMEILKD